MAHTVKLNLNTNVVNHKDVSIEVSGSNGKLGTLLVSKGNIEWLPSPKSVKKHRLSWAKFAQLMQDQGRPARAKPKKPAAATKSASVQKKAA
ncbi:hypothetical protein GCM10027034_20020 [Ramlibacter solisilvae]|uniref:hypothetical protein n=1 Tax=Ramlibacter tataouinensis TaxID=94132 RepID=UPI0009EE9825|nr:hypothetical protein [Ramlibacter tataouinensis]